jgi:hypothetical protein
MAEEDLFGAIVIITGKKMDVISFLVGGNNEKRCVRKT